MRELSKGMQQKAQFAASIIHHPDLLILDEPFSGLDPVNQRLCATWCSRSTIAALPSCFPLTSWCTPNNCAITSS